ncbi:hypothetical protein L1887_16820 [Cichorium endivia]|nr:hypothetical protein L1887_16820 [Cichorium endivia]
MKQIMMSVEDPETTRAQPCKKGCGFPISPATKNLCSMCYNDYFLVNESAKLPRIITLQTSNNSQPSGLFDQLVRLVKQFWQSSDDGANDLKNNSCEFFCDTKVGFFGSTCRCGGRFCVVHRLPEEHACKCEYEAAGLEAVRSRGFLEGNPYLQINTDY